MQQRVIALLEQSIQARPDTVRADTQLDDLDGWDSMGMVMLVGELFDQLAVEIAIDDLNACKTVADIVALVPAET